MSEFKAKTQDEWTAFFLADPGPVRDGSVVTWIREEIARLAEIEAETLDDPKTRLISPGYHLRAFAKAIRSLP